MAVTINSMIISLDRLTGGGELNWWGGINRKDPVMKLINIAHSNGLIFLDNLTGFRIWQLEGGVFNTFSLNAPGVVTKLFVSLQKKGNF